MSRPITIATAVFGVAALAMLAATIWLIIDAHLAAEEAIRRYGANADSGAIQFLIAIIYFAPSAALLAVSAFGQWRRWKLRLLPQIAALAWVIALPALDILRVM
jgi:hypothetical protein